MTSCSEKSNKDYTLEFKGTSLWVEMDHPYERVKKDPQYTGCGNKWLYNAYRYDDLYADIFETLKESNKVGVCSLFVRFRNYNTDKYGNVTTAYKDRFIVEIAFEEVPKFKNATYFSNAYDLTSKIHNQAYYETLKSIRDAQIEQQEAERRRLEERVEWLRKHRRADYDNRMEELMSPL